MTTPDDEFLDTLRATFRLEAAEHVQAMASGLLDLEKSPDADERQRLVHQVFRAAHSLKGAARAVDFFDVEGLCQTLEETFAQWRRLESLPSDNELDAAHTALDAITQALGPTVAVPVLPPPGPARTLKPAPFSGRPSESPPPAGEDTVRIAIAKLDAQLLDAEEMLSVKLMSAERVRGVWKVAHRLETWRKEWTSIERHARAIRPGVEQKASDNPALAASITRLLDFLDWTFDFQKSLESEVTALGRTAEHDALTVAKLVGDLLENSKKLLLLPFGTLTAQLPKMVRDLGREQGKDLELFVTGEHIEVDKRILEDIKDPLIHLLRNSVDHGIETPEERVRRGKPPRGRITIAATQLAGSTVQVILADDGTGIDPQNVRDAAIAQARLSQVDAAKLDDRHATELIFEPDISTRTTVTRLSGRGLGLAIVRERAERLGGRVSVESQAGEGARFTLVLPATLATFRGILVECAGREFVVPTSQVERVVSVAADDIGSVEGRPTLSLDGRAVAFARLQDVLQLAGDDGAGDDGRVTVIVVGTGDQRIALKIGAVLDEQEVIVKPLRKPLSRVRNIGGATILPSGRVTPVLNVPDLIASTRRARPTRGPALAGAVPARASKSVLVAEDSITSRVLMKTILESAGFEVTTAVDGMEAFTLLRAGQFDVLVSDVEMPRLNGFDLTARIRADKRLSDLPVVLVTALEAAEDRARGIDVGASAYIVKSRFDQHDLVTALRRLV